MSNIGALYDASLLSVDPRSDLRMVTLKSHSRIFEHFCAKIRRPLRDGLGFRRPGLECQNHNLPMRSTHAFPPQDEDELLKPLKQSAYLKHDEVNAADDRDEFGFYYKGAEPTRFGDWAHKGRATDF